MPNTCRDCYYFSAYQFDTEDGDGWCIFTQTEVNEEDFSCDRFKTSEEVRFPR